MSRLRGSASRGPLKVVEPQQLRQRVRVALALGVLGLTALALTAVGLTTLGLTAVAVTPKASAQVLAPEAGGCGAGGVEGAEGVEADLDGSGATAVVSGRVAGCRSTTGTGARGGGARGGARPYFSYEIVCSTDRYRAAAGLCSATPCEGGTYFALRTLHRPDGSIEPAGSSCIRLDQAEAAPGLTAADVFAAVRSVVLPSGSIRAAPSTRGLANLPADLWLVGDEIGPVDLRLAGSTIHAEFHPVAYRWSFESPRTGRSVQAVPASADPADRHGAAAVVFPRSGDFVVSVVTEWAATASLDGRFVGQVEGLASTARISYPVVELRADLDG